MGGQLECKGNVRVAGFNIHRIATLFYARPLPTSLPTLLAYLRSHHLFAVFKACANLEDGRGDRDDAFETILEYQLLASFPSYRTLYPPSIHRGLNTARRMLKRCSLRAQQERPIQT